MNDIEKLPPREPTRTEEIERMQYRLEGQQGDKPDSIENTEAWHEQQIARMVKLSKRLGGDSLRNL